MSDLERIRNTIADMFIGTDSGGYDEADAIMPLVEEAKRQGEVEVARAVSAWAMKNEIGPVPLDWAWLGEIMRRYLPEYEHGDGIGADHE